MGEIPARLRASLAGRYRIERELGAGGMATVYLAADLKHARQVAIKVLKPELAAVLGAERFVQEIRTTAALSHPHIVPLFDSGEADGFLYYVMPYIRGETVREKLNRETQFGVEEAVRITAEVADALDHAHRQGVIHRDIKPENILLHDGRAMVMDFGIALAVSAAAGGRVTESGLSLGTPHYMSPEQATADRQITARSDVYSLASVLYEMLTGEPPHMGTSAQQIIMKIIAEPVKAADELRKSVPPNVVAALGKALQKLPADRFDSAKAFAESLANPAFGARLAPGGQARPPGIRTVGLPVFVATALVAAVSLLALAVSWRRSEAPAAVTRIRLALQDTLTSHEMTTRAVLSHDGRQMATVAAGPDGVTHFVVLRFESIQPLPVPGTEGATNPAFSPDGRRLAFVSTSSPRALRVVPVDGGPPITLTDSLVDQGGVSWGDDGYVYYDARLPEGDGIARIRESGGAPELYTRPDTGTEQYHISPAALPGGRGLLFTIARAGGLESWDIGVQDGRSGRHRPILRGVFAVYARSGQIVYVTSDGALMAVPFDLEHLEVIGDPVALVDGVAVRGPNAKADVSVSDNGTLSYTVGEAPMSLEWVWVTRNGAVTPVDPTFVRAFTTRPSISPDGRFLAVAIADSSGGSVWVKQLAGGPFSKLSSKGRGPVFRPDGRSVVFTALPAVMQVPVDGSRAPAVLFDSMPPHASLDITSDGRWLVYQAAAIAIVGRRLDIDTVPRVFVSGPSAVTRPHVSPDGKWLAYVSDETGRPEVYVRPFPETATAKRQVSANGGTVVRWSPDGRELFFVERGLGLVAVPVLAGPAFGVGTPRPLFPVDGFEIARTEFAVAPDGRRFLFARRVEAATPRSGGVILVQNFFQELRTRVKPE